jgi:hypothetical protein
MGLHKMTENCKLRRAILSAFYNISQRNFGILLILWCPIKLWWNFCLDQNFSYKVKGPLHVVLLFCFKMHASPSVAGSITLRENNGPLKALLSQSQSAISPEMMIIISNNTVSRVQFGKTYTREFFKVFKSHSYFKLVQYRSSLKNSLVHVVFKLHSERYKCPYQQL